VLVDLSGWQLGFLALLQIQRDLFLEVSFAFVVFCNDAGAGARWMLWSKDAGPEVVELSLFLDFVDGLRRILVQDNAGTSPG
jgi:hypothetical protein